MSHAHYTKVTVYVNEQPTKPIAVIGLRATNTIAYAESVVRSMGFTLFDGLVTKIDDHILPKVEMR